MTNMSDKNLADLPHGSLIDVNTQEVFFQLGENLTLKLNLLEWLEFSKMVSDITEVISSRTQEDVYQCPTCDSVSVMASYREPTDEEYN